VNFESNERLSATVSYPEGLDTRVIADMTEHVRIILRRVDEFDSRQDGFRSYRQQLKHCTVSSPDNDTTINKGERGWHIVSINLVRRKWKTVVDIPDRETRVFGDSGNRVVNYIEIKGYNWLKEELINKRSMS